MNTIQVLCLCVVGCGFWFAGIVNDLVGSVTCNSWPVFVVVGSKIVLNNVKTHTVRTGYSSH